LEPKIRMRFRFNFLRRHAALGLLALSAPLIGACAISQQEEVAMGRQYAAEINRQLPIIQDPAVNRYVSLLGDRLAAQGTRKIAYTFYVVNTDVINAFALPGGYIYINRGLIERSSNLSELAGVMAHEIGHVELRHGVKEMQRVQKANLGLSLAYILLGRSPGGVESAAVNVAGAAILSSYSREAESESDSLAVPMLVRSGIDPDGLVTFFKKLLDEQKTRPSAVEQWFSTHPLTEARIADTRAQISRYPASQLRNLTVNTPQFDAMKAQLRKYPPPPPQFRQQK
jgi:predicted Zn-dependent protease